MAAIPEQQGCTPEAFGQIARSCRPVVLRQLVTHWPLVEAASRTPRAACDYLLQFDAGRTLDAFFGPPEIAGKYFYDESLTGFNFERRTLRLADALGALLKGLDAPGLPSVYAGSLPVDEYLPGFARDHTMPLVPPSVGARLWLGHASNVAVHYDAMDNIACVVAGRRRFTLYPPEATAKLYVGPIDHTMAGQPVSLAASSPPDPARYPLFEEVRDTALVADLEPGDALYLPKLWWHGIEASAPFNGLVNYWWDGFRAGPDAPYTALLLAMITIAERPAAERAAWKAYFDHYVFRSGGHPLRHLPPEKHGILGPLKPDNYGRIRAWVMHLLRGG
jgi:hypothetical protein